MTDTLDAAPQTLGEIPREPTQDGPAIRLYLVDGSGFIFRAFHALPPLTRKTDGLPVGAVSGFCNMIWKLLVDMRASPDAPTHLAVIFDHSEDTFRNKLYDQYKAHRQAVRLAGQRRQGVEGAEDEARAVHQVEPDLGAVLRRLARNLG